MPRQCLLCARPWATLDVHSLHRRRDGGSWARGGPGTCSRPHREQSPSPGLLAAGLGHSWRWLSCSGWATRSQALTWPQPRGRLLTLQLLPFISPRLGPPCTPALGQERGGFLLGFMPIIRLTPYNSRVLSPRSCGVSMKVGDHPTPTCMQDQNPSPPATPGATDQGPQQLCAAPCFTPVTGIDPVILGRPNDHAPIMDRENSVLGSASSHKAERRESRVC